MQTSAVKKVALYGTWASPITTDVILQGGASISELFVDAVTRVIYHIEHRPAEDGRDVIVETEKGRDIVGREFNSRTGVQEYGGAPAMAYGGIVYFSNFHDNRVYMVKEGEHPKPVTPDNKNFRYARLSAHPAFPHLLVAILEDHTHPLPADVVTTLCLINTNTSSVTTIVSGADFYAFPSFSPDGAHLAWEQWFHPDMPWEGTQIYITNVDVNEHSVTLSNARYVAGKKIEISASTPTWASNDVLIFTTDETGYHNPWTYSISSGKASPVLPVPRDEDFNNPMHLLAPEYSTPLDMFAQKAVYTALKDDRSKLYVLSISSGELDEVEFPYTDVVDLKRVADNAFVFLANSQDAPASLVVCVLADASNAESKAEFRTLEGLWRRDAPRFPRELISVAQSMTLETAKGEPLHVLYFPPTSLEYEAPQGEKPPCIVNAHGGPTARSTAALNWVQQYFTSRGWAWLDVNYGGSSGYGRKYIKRLEGNWGIVDVEDCARAMQQLSTTPYSFIDPTRSAIRGGSAGGYTTLATIAFKPDIFPAATSLYGIADLRSLAKDTHKFESHYLEKLMGGMIEEVPEVYDQRSPILYAGNIKTPVLVLQGALDAVVPPNQATTIVEAIKKRGGRVEYTVFEGEGHGWRKAETIKAALEQELHFYEDVFGIAGNNSLVGNWCAV